MSLRNNQQKVGDIKGHDIKRRYSFPLSPKKQVEIERLPDTELFGNQIEDIKDAQVDFLIDNVIAEVKKELP